MQKERGEALQLPFREMKQKWVLQRGIQALGGAGLSTDHTTPSEGLQTTNEVELGLKEHKRVLNESTKALSVKLRFVPYSQEATHGSFQEEPTAQ